MKIFFRDIAIFCFSLFSFSVITSCGGSEDNDPIINTNPTPTVSGSNNYAARIEVPKLESGNLFIHHSTEFNGDSVMTYCLEYNPKKYHSRWVAFRFDATTKQKNTKRPSVDPFMDDPSLPASQAIGFGGFGMNYKDLTGIQRSMSFDRGHICASADRLYSVESNAQTFYMTNMSPQISEFNQHFWIAFENHIQNLSQSAIFADTLYVVKGGTIDKVKNGTEDGVIGTIQRSNGSQVVIPKYYFMALLCLRNGNYKALGFLIEHKEYEYKNSGNDVSKEVMKSYAVSIDELEAFTGIDFFHNLPDGVENTVEAICDPSVWGL